MNRGRRAARAGLWSLALAAMGCTGAGDDTAGPCGAPEVEVGTGDRSFEPLAPGDAVEMVHGPQGGWHMLGSARVSGGASIVSLHFTIELVESGAIVSDNRLQVRLTEESECNGVFSGIYGYLDVTDLVDGERDTPPELLSYRDVAMRIEAHFGEGQAAGEARVTAWPDPQDADLAGPPPEP